MHSALAMHRRSARTHLRRLRANTAGGGGSWSAAAAAGSLAAAIASEGASAAGAAAAEPPEARLAPANLLAGLKKARMEPGGGCIATRRDARAAGLNQACFITNLPIAAAAAASCRMGHLICSPARSPLCCLPIDAGPPARLPAPLPAAPGPPPQALCFKRRHDRGGSPAERGRPARGQVAAH